MFNLPLQGDQWCIQEGHRSAVFNESVNLKQPDFGFTTIFTGDVLHNLNVKIIWLITANKDVHNYYGITIMHMCISTIVLKCCQWPYVAPNLTLQEYRNQHENKQIFIKDRKMKVSQPAYFQFVKEYQFWFQQYYRLIHPTW